MPKKITNIFLSGLIIVFSFFYTNEIIKISKNNDPIMIEIKNASEMFSDTKEDSIIVDNDIIPGKKGMKVDIEGSYKVMKKAGKYDKNLLVFKESIPEKNIKSNYKNYISSLNKSQNSVSLVLVFTNNDNLLSILNILNNKNITATFFLTKELFDNSMNLVRKIISSGNQVELLSNTYTVYEVNKYNSYLKLITDEKLNFCLNIDKDDKLLKACDSSKLYSISTDKLINNNLYMYVKKNLNNGLILVLDNSNNNIKELSSTINYINQKGKKFVLLKSIIE